jgi:hypothetical protein
MLRACDSNAITGQIDIISLRKEPDISCKTTPRIRKHYATNDGDSAVSCMADHAAGPAWGAVRSHASTA